MPSFTRMITSRMKPPTMGSGLKTAKGFSTGRSSSRINLGSKISNKDQGLKNVISSSRVNAGIKQNKIISSDQII